MRKAHFDYLDGWRGLAIGFLLIGHFFPVPGINLGTVGVNLFFVLSGLLMARLLFVYDTPIPVFYKRRISRISPAVVFFLAAVIVAYLVSGFEIAWMEVAAAVLFLNNYFPDPANTVLPFGHIWSLCVEEHSYILLSFLALTARRGWARPAWITGFFAALFGVIGVYYWTRYSGRELDFGYWIHSEVSAFGIFVSAALLLCFQGRRIPTLPLFAYPILIGLGIALHWWSVPQPVRTVFGVGLFALAINLLAEAPQLIRSMLSFRPLRQLGIWSFSIYLWQQPFYLLVYREGMSRWLALGLSLLAGVMSFYFIERPAREYLNRRWADVSSFGKEEAAQVLTPQ